MSIVNDEFLSHYSVNSDTFDIQRLYVGSSLRPIDGIVKAKRHGRSSQTAMPIGLNDKSVTM